ncbi:hypothetical protein F5Y16DRAFT_416086 [Xylariaceae sp. FL0255]|nr:hypothetical protein F5Y16DRAFT_416086 [Xylariaceae sp. FL0255]
MSFEKRTSLMPLKYPSQDLMCHFRQPAYTSSDNGRNSDDTLRPDQENEQHFDIPGNKFAFIPAQLNKLSNPTSLPTFCALGELAGLEEGLRTNLKDGLSIKERRLEGKVSFRKSFARSSAERRGPQEDPCMRLDTIDIDVGQRSFPPSKNVPLIESIPLEHIVYLAKSDGPVEYAAMRVIVATIISCEVVLEIPKARKLEYIDYETLHYGFSTVVQSGHTWVIPRTQVVVGDLLTVKTGYALTVDAS